MKVRTQCNSKNITAGEEYEFTSVAEDYQDYLSKEGVNDVGNITLDNGYSAFILVGKNARCAFLNGGEDGYWEVVSDE